MLTKWSVKKPYSVIVAVAIILVLGVAAFLGIRTDLLPDVDYPYAVVITNYPDASPEEVEEIVTRPIEKALASVGRVTNMNSVSTEGKSIVTVEFSQSTNMDSVVAEMREVFEPLSDDWSRSVSTPSIQKVNPDTMPVIVASVDLEGSDSAEISKFLNETLMTYFDGIEGIADMSVIGLVSEQVQITIDPEKLAAVNETIFQAISGDYAKARAALEATDAELSGASSQLSSALLNQTSSIDNQLRSLNSQLSRAKATAAASSERADALKEQIADLEQRLAAYSGGDEERELTEEEAADINSLQTSLTTAKAQLTAAEASVTDNNGTVASLQSEIANLENQREALTLQMGNSESELAESKASITKQLSDLSAAEETAKAEADLRSMITTEMVSTMLAAQNFSSTAGSLALGNREYAVKVGDRISSVDELENLVLFHFNLDGVSDVLLSDVANVSLVNDSGNVYSRINGHDGVLISFVKQSDYSTTEVAENIWNTFDEISKAYPQVTITPLSDRSLYIDRVRTGVWDNLLYGAVLAIVVLVLFLRDYRPTLVVATAIPVSLLFAVALMYFTGVTLNVFSLAGLALGVGMLVDNSIVVMENIYRCRTSGMSRAAAAMTGVRQVGPAIVSSTLTTICVFLPVVFTDGLSRQLFADVGLTIAYALLASLLIAFTLVPAMSSNILRNMKPKSMNFGRRALTKYESILRWVLEHRVFVLLFACVLLVFSAVFAVSRGSSFLPETDSTEMTLSVTMEEETTKEVLWNTTDKIVELLRDMDDVKSVGAVNDAGGTISMLGDVSEGNATNVYVVLKDNKKHSCGEIAETLLAETENLGCRIDVSIGSYDLSSLYNDGIQITVCGEDLSELASITRDMGDLLLSVEGADNVRSTMDTATPTLRVSVNKTEAMRYGLTVSDVYDFISMSISNSANATTLSENGSDGTDVIVIDGNSGDLSLADIQNLKMTVSNDDGTTSDVVIGSIATISEEEGPPVIYRDNQIRYMTASADVADGYNVGLVSDEIRQLVEGYQPPEGYTVTISGEESAISDSFGDLLFVMCLALLLMYLIMVAQFQSLRLPLIIMVTVPLAFTGGFLALLISGKDFSVIAVVGFLLLSGIVVNNGIVLVDYIDQLRRAGKGLSASIIEGCRVRLRPVLMTASTTILALLTLAAGVGLGAEVIQPMAIVVLGGLLYATCVTLFVVPVIYDLVLRRRSDAAVEDIVGLVRPDSPDEEDGAEPAERERRRFFGRGKKTEEDGDTEPDAFGPAAETSPEDGDTLFETDEPLPAEDGTASEEDGEPSEKEGWLSRFRRRFSGKKDAAAEANEADVGTDSEEAEENVPEETIEITDFVHIIHPYRAPAEDAETSTEKDALAAAANHEGAAGNESDEVVVDADDDDVVDVDDDDVVDVEEEEKEEKESVFARFVHWLRADEIDDEEYDEEDEDEEEDEDDEDELYEYEDTPRFLRPLIRLFSRSEEDDDEDDDEDYYGLKERRREEETMKSSEGPKIAADLERGAAGKTLENEGGDDERS